MSEKFTASNGVVVEENERGLILSTNDWKAGREALWELFLKERDQALGRWRWPEDPGYVVTPAAPKSDVVNVTNERKGASAAFSRARIGCHPHHEPFRRAASAYFAAHPLPKPWMEVAEGVYAVTPQAHPYERLVMFRGGEWLHLYKSTSDGQGEVHTAEWVAKIAYNEGRLTRLVPEVVES